jgi:hypothetical protein
VYDHVGNADVHLLGLSDLGHIEVYYSFLENALHFVHFWIVSNLYQSVVNLSQVNLMNDVFRL